MWLNCQEISYQDRLLLKFVLLGLITLILGKYFPSVTERTPYDQKPFVTERTPYDPSAWTPIEIENATGSSECTFVEHPIKLRSTYFEIEDHSRTRDSNGEPQVTSYHRHFSGTVDYIWRSEGLQTIRVHAPMQREAMQWTPGFPIKIAGVTTTCKEFCSVHEESCSFVGRDTNLSKSSSQLRIGVDGLKRRYQDDTETKDENCLAGEVHHELDTAMDLEKDKAATLSIKSSENNMKLDIPLIKPPPNAIPFSDEWLAAIEAAGEDILTLKCGAVQNSPPDKSLPEPGPWSPVWKPNIEHQVASNFELRASKTNYYR